MKITELDWSLVPDQAVMVYIGRRKSGKTTNIIDTFYKKRNSFKFGLVFCGSKSTIKEYERHFPSSFIYYGYHSAILAKLIDKQEMNVELGIAEPVFVLVDDCMWAKKSILADPNIRRVFMNGRHSLIFFVLSMQYCMDLHPSMRQQIDYTFLSREKNPQNRERLFRNYNVCFKTYAQFDDTMMQCTLNHETFVLNNGGTDSDLPEDNVSWWKAKYDPKGRRFRVNKHGSWWKFHKKRFNPTFFVKGDMKSKGESKNGIIKVRKTPNRRESKYKMRPFRPKLRPVPEIQQTSRGSSWVQRQRDQNLGPRSNGFSLSKKGLQPKLRFKQIDQSVKYI